MRKINIAGIGNHAICGKLTLQALAIMPQSTNIFNKKTYVYLINIIHLLMLSYIVKNLNICYSGEKFI